MASNRLEHIGLVHESTQIKSGTWIGNVFIYSTHTHFKYFLTNGDNGSIRTVDSPLYITGVTGNQVHALDRDVKTRTIAIDPTEFHFKQALADKKFDVVRQMIKEQNLVGQAIISYLQQKGYPEIALQFSRDDRTRYDLAMQCGHLEVALDCAGRLDDKATWTRLAAEALRQGNIKIVELSYRKTQDFERLAFLTLLNGDVKTLDRMQKIAESKGDVMAQFQTALYKGDVASRVAILASVGQLTLAYATAATHGLAEQAEAIGTKLTEAGLELPMLNPKATLLSPPEPVFRPAEPNWPVLNIPKPWLDSFSIESVPSALAMAEEDAAPSGDWGADAGLDDNEPKLDDGDWGEPEETPQAEPETGGGWEADALGALDDIMESTSKGPKDTFWVPPQPGRSISAIWTANSTLVADLVAAGSFDAALLALNSQAGIIDFAPLREVMLSIRSSVVASLPGLPSLPPTLTGLNRNGPSLPNISNALPLLPITLAGLSEKLKGAYSLTTAGKFVESQAQFLEILHSIAFLALDNKPDITEAMALLGVCRDYVTGLRIELARKEEQDPKRSTELAAYFCHIPLQVPHLQLALRSAMNQAYRVKNLITASSFARRLLDLSPKADLAAQARKVVQLAEASPSNAVQLNYDERNPFVVCAATLVPIYAGNPVSKCSYCSAPHSPSVAGSVCRICLVGEVGKDVPGLNLRARSK